MGQYLLTGGTCGVDWSKVLTLAKRTLLTLDLIDEAACRHVWAPNITSVAGGVTHKFYIVRVNDTPRCDSIKHCDAWRLKWHSSLRQYQALWCLTFHLRVYQNESPSKLWTMRWNNGALTLHSIPLQPSLLRDHNFPCWDTGLSERGVEKRNTLIACRQRNCQ